MNHLLSFALKKYICKLHFTTIEDTRQKKNQRLHIANKSWSHILEYTTICLIQIDTVIIKLTILNKLFVLIRFIHNNLGDILGPAKACTRNSMHTP
jgi:hypothetical protein